MSVFSFATSSRRRTVAAIAMASSLLLCAGASVWYTRAVANGDAAASRASDDSVGILLGLARKAEHAGNVVAPQGSNAYEFYLSVLQLDPRNATANRRLRELFTRACSEVELAVSQAQLDEAARELRLLRDYDSDNYKLSLLGGYLDAQRVLMTRRHEAQARLIQQKQSEAR